MCELHTLAPLPLSSLPLHIVLTMGRTPLFLHRTEHEHAWGGLQGWMDGETCCQGGIAEITGTGWLSTLYLLLIHPFLCSSTLLGWLKAQASLGIQRPSIGSQEPKPDYQLCRLYLLDKLAA
jgi:hypothetical protein